MLYEVITLSDMLARTDAYRLGPADRLAPLLEASTGLEDVGGSAASILTTIWLEDVAVRRQRIASIRNNFV